MSRSEKNKTLVIEEKEKAQLLEEVTQALNVKQDAHHILNTIILEDIFSAAQYLPDAFVDLLIVDPPYNLNKNFGKVDFKKSHVDAYSAYLDAFLLKIMHTLKDTASVYICGDWYSSLSIYSVASKYFKVHNRITWQREKGRGAKRNWKSAHEDIWFCSMSKEFVFNGDDIKTRKKVLAPYTNNNMPKDWETTESGNFRNTHASNFWDDITIPYWSMKENTTHPTQKPEKLVAKLILASSNEGDVVFDPFVGSGTSCVVAKKLNRKYLGIDIDEYYVSVSQKRLNSVSDNVIQGYSDGVFWERNSLSVQLKQLKKNNNT